MAGVFGVLLTYFRTTVEKWPFGWVAVPLSVVFFAAAWFAQRLDKLSSEEDKTTDLREAKEKAERLFLGVSDVLRPLAALLLDVADMSCSGAERRDAMGRLRLGCVVAVAELSAPQRARSCLFEFEEDGETLVPKEHHGRSDVPTSRFNLGEDTPYTEILTMLNTHRAVLYDDVDQQPPQGWDPEHTHGYRCFIRAPIRSERYIYGMLTVDAPEVGTLGETDAELLSTVATILAAGYAAQKTTSRMSPSPDVVGA
jgi:transcriptional regulator with GAF, ATPase, and Fis domain